MKWYIYYILIKYYDDICYIKQFQPGGRGRKMAFNISAELSSEIVSAVRDVCVHKHKIFTK